MKYSTWEVIAFITAMISFGLYIATEHLPFAIFGLFNMILSTENAILGAIEKTKEGR